MLTVQQDPVPITFNSLINDTQFYAKRKHLYGIALSSWEKKSKMKVMNKHGTIMEEWKTSKALKLWRLYLTLKTKKGQKY